MDTSFRYLVVLFLRASTDLIISYLEVQDCFRELTVHEPPAIYYTEADPLKPVANRNPYMPQAASCLQNHMTKRTLNRPRSPTKTTTMQPDLSRWTAHDVFPHARPRCSRLAATDFPRETQARSGPEGQSQDARRGWSTWTITSE